MKNKPLLIVESPTKVKTIQQYLGNNYDVISCVGHVKDLPRKELGIDIENDFKIDLKVLPDKNKFIKELRKKSKTAERVMIATDPDREGEAIAAHLASEVPEEKLERVQFTEITKRGIEEGIKKVRDINRNLVSAQTARRVIDRLVGYKVSPVLWATLQSNMKFVSTNLSAGRVQSAAVKIIVDRDRLRSKFKRTKYFDLKAKLSPPGSENSFSANLFKLDGKKIVTSNDFDSKNGALKTKNVVLLLENQANLLLEQINNEQWKVVDINEKPRTSNPKPPFTTSTLQQEASRKLRSSARQTMSAAQKLYENGFITYMRTDSTHLSDEALEGARRVVKNKFGEEFLPTAPKQYKSKVKNIQEAHEAIRPAHKKFESIDKVKKILGQDCALIYELIWKRTVASQMKSAKLKQTSVIVSVKNADFKATGQVILFPGYMKVYVEGKDNPSKDLADKEKILPDLEKDCILNCMSLEAVIHNTNPPARYTEASLVKALEENGIGRPSTFASIIATIVKREYVNRKSGKLLPTFLGLAVTQLLENHFTNLVSKEFTAEMENRLDEISRGEQKSIPFMDNFYHGGEHFIGLENMLKEKVDIPLACTIPLPEEVSKNTEGRIGRFGPYLRRGDDTRSISEEIFIGDLTSQKVEEIFQTETKEDEPIGSDPVSGDSIWLKKGPYGYYVQIGETKKRKGIPKGFLLSDVNLDYALKLLSLPREVGTHPESGEIIFADYGRYGPYLKCGKINASLRGQETPLDIELSKALELLKNRNKRSSELRNIGSHPDTGEDLLIKDGRYGPYLSDGKFNVALKGDLTPENITLETAVDLINQKRLTPSKKRKKRKKKK